jgi:toxin-antitoxin system PIN domain toxin
VILPDLNLLIYAHNEAAPQHSRARQWWEDLIQREHPIGMPWAVALGFVRLVTHPRVLEQPLPPALALGYVETWLEHSCVRILDPGPRHVRLLHALFEAAGVAGSLTTDAHLAALAIEHQCELHSNDGDFARFPGLRWHNPLAD